MSKQAATRVVASAIIPGVTCWDTGTDPVAASATAIGAVSLGWTLRRES